MIPTVLRCITILICLGVLAAPGVVAAELACKTIPKLMLAFLENHVEHRVLSEELRDRTVDTYLRRSDPSRTLLLESEVKKLRKKLGNVFDGIKGGDCKDLETFQEQMLVRHEKVEEFVREFVSADDYTIDPNVRWVIDVDEREYPKSEAEREELTRSQVHFQMSNYLASDSTLEEAKERLIHRYELRTKRIAELERDELYSLFIDSFAISLDPHSNYLSSDVLEDFRIQMSLELEGIGVALSERDGFAVVERIIPGGAADRLDVLKENDKLISVAQDGNDYVSIIDMPLRDAVSLIRGKKGSKVHLMVLRKGEVTERFPLTIVRDTINLEEQAASLRFVERKIGDENLKLGILDLPSFYGDTDPKKRQCTDDVARLLREASDEKVDGLIMDLSGNGGGLLEHAVTVSGFFLRRGEIVGIESSAGQAHVMSDRDESVLYSGPLVIHTSRVSASAAEILTGALKDYRRAVIAGDDHTFGKGTVQTVTPLPPGQGALKVTTAMFFRPGGKSTQNDGVRADVVIPSALSSDDFGEKNQRYALTSQTVSKFLSTQANANSPPSSNHWKPVDNEVIDVLAERSKKRVEESERFEEIRELLREAEENGGVVVLGDIEKRREEEQAKEAAVDEAEEEDDAEELTPQLEEALNVLVDLVELNS